MKKLALLILMLVFATPVMAQFDAFQTPNGVYMTGDHGSIEARGNPLSGGIANVTVYIPIDLKTFGISPGFVSMYVPAPIWAQDGEYKVVDVPCEGGARKYYDVSNATDRAALELAAGTAVIVIRGSEADCWAGSVFLWLVF